MLALVWPAARLGTLRPGWGCGRRVAEVGAGPGRAAGRRESRSDYRRCSTATGVGCRCVRIAFLAVDVEATIGTTLFHFRDAGRDSFLLLRDRIFA